MDVERTIQFLLKNQARMDARMDAKFAKADARFTKAEKRLDRLDRVVAQNNRVVTRLVRYGVSLRSDVRRIDKALAETDEKLNALGSADDRGTEDRGQGPRCSLSGAHAHVHHRGFQATQEGRLTVLSPPSLTPPSSSVRGQPFRFKRR